MENINIEGKWCTEDCKWNNNSCHRISIYNYCSPEQWKIISNLKVHTLFISWEVDEEDIIRLSKMKVYSLSMRPVIRNTIPALSELVKNKHLRELCLASCVSNNMLDITYSKTLQCLHLYDCFVQNDFLKAIAQNKTLKYLSLRNCNITDNDVKILSQNKILTGLNLVHNLITDKGATILSNNNTLQQLDLIYNPKISDIGKMTFQNNRTLNTLNLNITNGKYYIYNLDRGGHRHPTTISYQSRVKYINYILKIKQHVNKYFIDDITNIIIEYIKYKDCVTKTKLRRSKRLKI